MPKKILLVEDEAIIALAEAKTLHNHGFTVVTAYNGEQAIEKIDTEPDIDLVLMDIDLGSGMDGTEAARIILEKHTIPIVFLSSHTEPEVVEKTEKITAYGYVVKNSGETVLINSLKMAFRLYQSFIKEQENERLMSAIVSASPVSIYGIDTDGKVNIWNESSERVFGWKAEEVLGAPLPIIPEDKREEFQGFRETALAGKTIFRKRVVRRRKDGSRFPGTLSVAPLYDVKGDIFAFVGLMEDISQLEESEERFRLMVENNPDPMFIHTDFIFDYVNPAALKLFGAASETELVGTPVMDRIHPEYHDSSYHRIRTMLKEDRAISEKIEQQYRSIDDRTFWVEATGIPLTYRGQQAILTTVREISERKQREQELHESRENLRITLDSIGDAVIATDLKGNVRRMNRIAEELTGWEIAEAKGKPLEEVLTIINAETGERVDTPVKRVLNTGKIVGLANHTVLVSKNGAKYQIADSAAPIMDQDDEINGVVLVFRDITEEYRKTNKLRESKEFLDAVLYSIQDGISIIDADMNITYTNEVVEKWYPAEAPLVGKKCYHAYHGFSAPCSPCPSLRCIESGKTEVDIVPGNIHQDSPALWLEVYSYPFKDSQTGAVKGVIEFVRDITKRKRHEEALQKALEEKEFLMKELNHRVKNNLAIISSLLQIEESTRGGDTDFSDITSRIDAIRIIHEKLLQTDDITRIELGGYIDDLLNTVFTSLRTQPVAVDNTIGKVTIPTKPAVALGLIVNEIATNAIKHGFTDTEAARFSVGIEHDSSEETYILSLSNNGRPFPDDIDIENPQSIGLQLITNLTDQLNGTIDLKREPFPIFTIRFSVETE